MNLHEVGNKFRVPNESHTSSLELFQYMWISINDISSITIRNMVYKYGNHYVSIDHMAR
jgi:hypothetical protein